MKGFSNMGRFSAYPAMLVVAMAAAPALAAATTPSELVANPSDYDGKNVSVSGTVAKFQTNKTLMGTVAAYQLCDQKCVVVIDETNGTHKNGDKVTATGTFKTSFSGPQRSFKNVVLVK